MPKPQVQEQVRIDVPLADRLAAAVTTTGRSRADILREAITQWLDRHEGGTE